MASTDTFFWKRVRADLQFTGGFLVLSALSIIFGLFTYPLVHKQPWAGFAWRHVGEGMPYIILIYILAMLVFALISSYYRDLDFKRIPQPTRDRFKTMLARYTSAEQGFEGFIQSLSTHAWMDGEKNHFVIFLRKEGFSYFDLQVLFKKHSLVEYTNLVELRLLAIKNEAAGVLIVSSIFACTIWSILMAAIPAVGQLFWQADGKFNTQVFSQVGGATAAILTVVIMLAKSKKDN